MTHITPEQLAEWKRDATEGALTMSFNARILALITALEQSQADLKEAREALKPFANEANSWPGADADYRSDFYNGTFSVGDFRRAAKAGGVM